MSRPDYRIALDLSCLVPQPLTGVGYYTKHLFEAFLRQNPGIGATIFSSSAQPQSEVLKSLGLSASRAVHIRCPTRLRVRLWTRMNGPSLEWFTGRADIVHGAFHALPPSRLAKRVVTVFDLSSQRREGTHLRKAAALDLRLLRHATARADGIIAISESCKADLVELYGVDPQRVFVVHGGVDYAAFATPVDTAVRDAVLKRFGLTDTPYFIHLGTLEPRKNLPRLLEAYSQLRSEEPAAPKLVLAGREGWLFENVFATIERLQLADAVCITGYLERQDAVALLQGAAGCVYPSLYEGFGLPVLEAMAAGVPVLTSNVSSLPEVVGETGILVNPESVEEIAEGLHGLLRAGESGAPDCAAARTRAQQFTWDKSAQTLAGVYERILAGSAH